MSISFDYEWCRRGGGGSDEGGCVDVGSVVHVDTDVEELWLLNEWECWHGCIILGIWKFRGQDVRSVLSHGRDRERAGGQKLCLS